MTKQHSSMGVLYLIPSLLHMEALATIPPQVTAVVRATRHFFVENERSARRFLKRLDRTLSIDDRHFSLVNTHQQADLPLLRSWLQNKCDVGVISEAGYPCIADPGHVLVHAAHEMGTRVVPLSGPNAMLMALSASGFNGQQFRFSGYLPRDSRQRIQALRALEKKVQQNGETQLFMEAPYRNNQLLDDLLRHGNPETWLCIAADLTGPAEFIATYRLKDWPHHRPELHKRPAVFLLGR